MDLAHPKILRDAPYVIFLGIWMYRLSARGLTYNNNSGQLSIEYLRPDPTSQFSKRIYPTERQLRQHVATQVRRETSPAPPGCTTHCPNPKPDPIPTFTGGVSYVYHDVAKVPAVSTQA